jgi:two-component system, NarL family, nitrate/nitrite response regulator NarL
MAQFRIVLIHPCQLFREGIARLLKGCKLRVVVSAPTLPKALDSFAPTEQPQLALWGFERDSDINDRFAELQRARADAPDLRTVVLAPAPNRTLLSWAAESGIDAVLSKDISGEVLQRSLELVMLGQQLFPALAVTSTGAPSAAWVEPLAAQDLPEFTGPKLPPVPCADSSAVLSDRENQIMRRLIGGASNKLIGRDLGITEGTVKVHIKSLLRKVGAANRTQAAIWGIDHGSLLRSEPIPTGANDRMSTRVAFQANAAE